MPIDLPPAIRTNAVELIKHLEGFKPTSYRLPKELWPTVGYGTSLSPDKRQVFSNLFGTNVNFDQVYSGAQDLTKPQANSLLTNHLHSISNRLFKRMPSLPKYNPELQGALLNGAYRGDIFQSPKAVNLMNNSNWLNGAKEYLNNKEFKTTDLPGVVKRMKYNAEVFKKQSSHNPDKLHHSVYVVELDEEAKKNHKLMKNNPQADSSKPALYVGATGLPVEERFKNQKKGYKGNLLVQRHGLHLREDLFKHLNPMTEPDCYAMEKELALKLKQEGYVVKQAKPNIDYTKLPEQMLKTKVDNKFTGIKMIMIRIVCCRPGTADSKAVKAPS